MHLPLSVRGNDPVVQGLAAHAERIAGALIGTRSVAVDGNGEALDSDSRHFMPPLGLPLKTKLSEPAHGTRGLQPEPRWPGSVRRIVRPLCVTVHDEYTLTKSDPQTPRPCSDKTLGSAPSPRPSGR